MSVTQHEKAVRFRALHEGAPFIIANAWDGSSARLLSQLGFPALATSSGASAATLGKRDGELSRDESLGIAAEVVAATDLPVSADLEKGFGDGPEDVAETIRRASAVGLVGASIEDASGDPAEPIFPLALAVRRIEAAVAAARALKAPFVLTARAENFLRQRPDLDDTIKRLRAFEAAGADVLFAPGLPDLESVRAVCAAVERPVNFMVGLKHASFSVPELKQAGVKRISLASTLYRAALSGLRRAACEVLEQGTFRYLEDI